ncbi:MAG: lytic murein transglycosylase, partial [Pseudonocardiaceae bacterium]
AYDRAVGPMQFIPSTWARWASDGDGDGQADPHDIDDAAVTAARYLCADRRDVGTARGWWAAVLSYNNSVDYAQRVFGAADAYARRSR